MQLKLLGENAERWVSLPLGLNPSRHAKPRSLATGIDGETKADYAKDLESNLVDLHERLRSRRYRATPSRRAWVPKEGGQRRAISIPALEDKIVQRAVAMLLEPIYEQDFCDFSYRFRPKVGAHHALRALREEIMDLKGVWLVDADIRGQVWPVAASGEDQPCTVQEAGVARGHAKGVWERYVPFSRTDPLLDPFKAMRACNIQNTR